jgi:predicted outer membrane repeat protein
MQDSSLDSNTASTYDGGGIYSSGSSDLSNVSITNNGARRNGGGVYVVAATTTCDTCTIQDNTAGNAGTGGAWAANSTLTLTTCTTNGTFVQA